MGPGLFLQMFQQESKSPLSVCYRRTEEEVGRVCMSDEGVEPPGATIKTVREIHPKSKKCIIKDCCGNIVGFLCTFCEMFPFILTTFVSLDHYQVCPAFFWVTFRNSEPGCENSHTYVKPAQTQSDTYYSYMTMSLIDQSSFYVCRFHKMLRSILTNTSEIKPQHF